MVTPADAIEAKIAKKLVEDIQGYFVRKLDDLSHTFGRDIGCEAVEWLRDEGRHGGGIRYETRDELVFNRGSVNISQVHYDDDATKRLGSATALSTIIHPQNPHAPSMHMHISWTQMKEGEGYWRIMADLNPSMVDRVSQREFDRMLEEVSGDYYEEGTEQGDRYFDIPVLGRTRGVSHFYLENFNSGHFDQDLAFAKRFGENVIDTYIGIVLQALGYYRTFDAEDKAQQLRYHTLYLFQVLTLDRGTTAGLLIHDQNDIGIMGSIPSHVDRALLQSWVGKMPKPQDELLQAVIDILPEESPSPVTLEVKKKLANTVREHYKRHPEALDMQASGNTTPPTVENHR
ncbi:MAG: coproporphyrinogen III oxidase [Campylobacterales bacterium]|nr:coproporphyrinogen III oxidase [Campylobacterales bacterium]